MFKMFYIIIIIIMINIADEQYRVFSKILEDIENKQVETFKILELDSIVLQKLKATMGTKDKVM